jgi:hypothetical protein
VCFYLARELGNLGDPRLAAPAQDQTIRSATVDSLIAVLEKCPPEAASGRPPADDPESLPAMRQLAGEYPDFATRRALLQACERIAP